MELNTRELKLLNQSLDTMILKVDGAIGIIIDIDRHYSVGGDLNNLLAELRQLQHKVVEEWHEVTYRTAQRRLTDGPVE